MKKGPFMKRAFEGVQEPWRTHSTDEYETPAVFEEKRMKEKLVA